MYQNYIFDLYGTLVDIHTDEEQDSLFEKLAMFYGYYGAHYKPNQLKEKFREKIDILEKENENPNAEISLDLIFKGLFDDCQISASDELILHTGQLFRILSMEYVRLYPNAKAFLLHLKEKGKNVYLLSNAQHMFTWYELEYLGIRECFDDIFISSECGVKKPGSKFFMNLIEKHNLDATKSIMIGNDGTSDIKGAKTVGLDTCYIYSNCSPKEKLPKATYVFEEMDIENVERKLLL